MTINKTGIMAKIKYILSMPLLLITIMIVTANFNSFGQKDKIYKEVDVMPKYQNDVMWRGVREFIQQNLYYPQSAKDNNISAKIYAQFVIDENGEVADIEIKRIDILDNASEEIVVKIKGYTPDSNTGIDSKSVKVKDNIFLVLMSLS